MSAPPLIPFQGDWQTYEDEIYEAFLDSFVRRDVRFRGVRVTAPFRPPTRGKSYSFWHLISQAPEVGNRREEDRVPDFRRCERIRWVSWAIETVSEGTATARWWENRRGAETRVVIWLVDHDYAVILAKRRGYYVLKTAYSGIKPHQRRRFEAEHSEYTKTQKD